MKLTDLFFIGRPSRQVSEFLNKDTLYAGKIVGAVPRLVSNVTDEAYVVRLLPPSMQEFSEGLHIMLLDDLIGFTLFQVQETWESEYRRLLLIEETRRREQPLDEDSQRTTDEFHDVLNRKAAGEKNVRWSAEPRVRYMQCVQLHPKARVSVRQIGPVEDENIDPQSLEFLDTYEKLLAYLRQHWEKHGRKAATYKWAIYDDKNPQWASAKIEFQKEEDEYLADLNERKELLR